MSFKEYSVPQFTVDEDLAALVERLAKPKPFENLSFNAALRRVLEGGSGAQKDAQLEKLLAEAMATSSKEPKKAPSPDPRKWIASVPELRGKKGLQTWQAVCLLLRVDTAGDSARRKLKNWVKSNRPNWPAVPEIEGE